MYKVNSRALSAHLCLLAFTAPVAGFKPVLQWLDLAFWLVLAHQTGLGEPLYPPSPCHEVYDRTGVLVEPLPVDRHTCARIAPFAAFVTAL